jgi:ribosomal protein S27AE
MDGKVKRLQERWKQRTDAAFQRMFAGKSEAELETLTQREDVAVLIGRELAAFLLEEHVALDEAVQPSEASSACCPKCGRPGKPAVQEEEELPERTVTTRTGEIRMRRQRWQCGKCRVIFFSARR